MLFTGNHARRTCVNRLYFRWCSATLAGERPPDRAAPSGHGGLQGNLMLYHAYELQRSFLSSASAIATIGANMLNSPLNPMTFFGGEPIMASALEVFAHASAP